MTSSHDTGRGADFVASYLLRPQDLALLRVIRRECVVPAFTQSRCIIDMYGTGSYFLQRRPRFIWWALYSLATIIRHGVKRTVRVSVPCCSMLCCKYPPGLTLVCLTSYLMVHTAILAVPTMHAVYFTGYSGHYITPGAVSDPLPALRAQKARL